MKNSCPPENQKFPKSCRLRTSDQFRQVFDRRLSAADTRLVLYAKPNGLNYPRLGLAVGKKFGNAVQRNRLKRMLREAFRTSRIDLPTGYDLVLLPKTERPQTTKNSKKQLQTPCNSNQPQASLEQYQKSLVLLSQKLHQRVLSKNQDN